MEIAAGVYDIGQGTYRSSYVHAFLVDDGNGLTLIDTLFENEPKRILRQIEAIGKNTSDLERIVLSHAHRSHLGGLAALKRLSGAKVYCHEWEADIVSGDRKAQSVTWRPTNPLRTYPIQMGHNLGVAKHPPCGVDHTLSGGEELGPLKVMHSPGHSPGHLSFYWPERRVLLCGDAIVTWPAFMLGWPGFTLNHKQQRASLDRLAELDVEVLGVGHGDPITSEGGKRLGALVDSRGGA
jgi:glyoxylase-like metal-dependent hydrolase (beta-lactamase superfamily II)